MLIIQNTKTYKTLGTMMVIVCHRMQGDTSLIYVQGWAVLGQRRSGCREAFSEKRVFNE
jgi:hypothetical protein